MARIRCTPACWACTAPSRPTLVWRTATLLITRGARFSDRVTGDTSRFAKKAKILQIDIDPAEINKNVLVSGSVIGDVKSVLDILNEKLPDMKHEAWIEEVEALKNQYPLKVDDDRLTGPYVVEEAVSRDKRRRHRHHRSRSKPDVGGTVL